PAPRRARSSPVLPRPRPSCRRTTWPCGRARAARSWLRRTRRGRARGRGAALRLRVRDDLLKTRQALVERAQEVLLLARDDAGDAAAGLAQFGIIGDE